MKKVFTLLTAICFAFNANAQTKILNISLEKTKKEHWCKFNICFDKISKNNIAALGSFMCDSKIFFTTKENTTYQFEGKMFGVINGKCIEVNASSYNKRGTRTNDFNFLLDGILFDNIKSIRVVLISESSFYSKSKIILDNTINSFMVL